MYNAENKTVMLPSGAEMYYAKFGKGSKQFVMIPGLNIVDMSETANNLAYLEIERFADHARAIYSHDSFDILDRIKYPTLVLGAKLDKITTAEGSKEIAEKLGCKLHIFQNEDHAAYLSKGFNCMVYDFLQKNDQAF